MFTLGKWNCELPKEVLLLPFIYYITCSTNQHKIHPCYSKNENNQSNEYQSFNVNTSRPVILM